MLYFIVVILGIVQMVNSYAFGIRKRMDYGFWYQQIRTAKPIWRPTCKVNESYHMHTRGYALSNVCRSPQRLCLVLALHPSSPSEITIASSVSSICAFLEGRECTISTISPSSSDLCLFTCFSVLMVRACFERLA